MKHKDIFRSYQELEIYFTQNPAQRFVNGWRLFTIGESEINQLLSHGVLPDKYNDSPLSPIQIVMTSYLFREYPEIEESYRRIELTSTCGKNAQQDCSVEQLSAIRASDFLEDLDQNKERWRQLDERQKQVILELEQEVEVMMQSNNNIFDKLTWNRKQRENYQEFTLRYKHLMLRIEKLLGGLGST